MSKYRRGPRTPMNFTLRTADIVGLPFESQGLSASDQPEHGVRQQVLDDNLDNSFNDVDDPVDGNPFHILIRPIGTDQHDVENQMTNWANARNAIAPNDFILPNITIPQLTTNLNNSWTAQIN